MMEKKTINNGRYDLYTCTAIAFESGNTERQPAILVHDNDSEFDADTVLFNYALSDLDSIEDADEPSAFSAEEETLRSVRIDGKTLREYAL